MCGPQVGVGRVSVADWWLEMERTEEEETEAAAAPAMTTVRAKIRTASFMMIPFFKMMKWAKAAFRYYKLANPK
jgi:hypothetical protein